jgi:hypothetical protein
METDTYLKSLTAEVERRRAADYQPTKESERMTPEKWSKETAALVRGFVERQVAPLRERIEQLEQRKTFFYRGTWSEHEQYDEDDFVTYQGSLWHCRETTRQRPGDGNVWQLAVKRGRDAR